MADLYAYGVAVHLYKPIVKRAVVDFAVSADWTPAAGDVKISKDGGAAANVTNLPTAITMGNTAMWDYSLTATEMQAAKIRITVADAATKAVEDTMFEIDTYGNASAQHAINLNDAVRAGLTALPNVAAEGAGGLYTRGSGAGQINQNANGQVDTRWVAGNVTVGTNNDKTAYSLSAAGIQAIWDALTSALTTVGSIGKLIVDNLNAAITSRMATFTLPTNFSSLSIDASGRVDLGKWIGVVPAAVSATGKYLQTMVLRWLTDDAGGTPDALSSGKLPADVKLWQTVGPNGLTLAGNLQADVEQWKGATAPNMPANFAAFSIDSSGRVTTTYPMHQNTAYANFMFLMRDSTTHQPKTGVTVSATRSIDGAAFAGCANAVVEMANGWYKIDLAAADLNCAREVALRFTGTAADDMDMKMVVQP